MGNVYGKMILILGWSVLVFYDGDDNFRDKHWILTSYDNSRKEEDKIRKSSTILNRPDSSNDTDSARRNSLISSGALSLPKDTPSLLNGQ